MSLTDYCRAGLPWECTWWGSMLTFYDPSAFERCREADDLYRACMAGGFNRNLPGGSGAGPAPDLAAQPGVNYNDPAVLAIIAEQQRKSDAVKWQQTIDATRGVMSGAPNDDSGNDFPWLAVLAFVALFVAFTLVKK